MSLLEQLQRFIAPIQRRISVLLSRGIVKTFSDTTNMPLVKIQLSSDEVKEDLEYIQTYGFTSVPEAGAEAVVGFFGGNRDNGVVLAIGDARARKKSLEPGDVCMYHKDGAYAIFKANNVIEVSGKNVNVLLEAGGQLNVGDGNLTVDA